MMITVETFIYLNHQHKRTYGTRNRSATAKYKYLYNTARMIFKIHMFPVPCMV